MKLALFSGAAAAVALLASAPAQAATITLDFTNDATGPQAEGFVSADYAGLQFYSELGAGLEVGDYSPQSDGRGLLARDDTNGNFIRGLFVDGTHTFLSLSFGNDDASFVNPGDLAVLRVFLSGSLVGETSITLSPDDILNQTISFAGGPFDSFAFVYTDATGNPFTGGNGKNVGLIEVIDNVTFDVAAVPEPATWAMMILGFGAVGAAVRRRRQVAFA